MWNISDDLYLLALGFDLRFIGLRLMIGFIASAVTAMPAGIVSDRIGRKASFILGDGIGAVIALIMISSRNEAILLAGPALVAFFNNLHHTSEAAFMMENSKGSERVHLFSVSTSFRTISSMAGALIAGLVPLMFEEALPARPLVPMAISLGFGVLFAAVVTLILVPCGYVIIEDLRGLLPGQTAEHAVPKAERDVGRIGVGVTSEVAGQQ